MRALVTGGAGFVGAHLVAALKARGDAVRVLDLKPLKGAEMIVGSIEDEASARAACRAIDTVYHLAGDAQLWAPDVERFDRINYRGTQSMLRAAVAEHVSRFVHCSSLTTLVGKQTPIGVSSADERTMLGVEDMLGLYPRSKLLAEQAALGAASCNLDVVVAIPTEPLGPGDESLTPPTRMIVDLLNGRIPATINCMLNFVSVRSLADGFIAVAERGRRGERYLLGGENVPMVRLLNEIERQSGQKMPKAQLPYAIALAAGALDTGLFARITGRPPRAPLTGVRLAGRRVSFISAKAEAELGWRSEPFERALADALLWFRERGLAPR